MTKKILITGSTDGIGLETAKMLASRGHHILLHGRNPEKLARAGAELSGSHLVEHYQADLSSLSGVQALVEAVTAKHQSLHVLINNAGVYNAAQQVTPDGLDVRFAVNTLAPVLLTRGLLPLLGNSGRVVNLSSAAQSSVDPTALVGARPLSEGHAYAQSKLALTMWSNQMARRHPQGPVFIAVNPGSLLGSKMVKKAFGVAGGDIRIGADILCRAALDEEFAGASGRYFDNDEGRFGDPHPDALNQIKSAEIVAHIEKILAAKSN